MTHAARLGLMVILAGSVAVGLTGPGAADAQEWKIYLLGKTEPIVASSYTEEAPWVFYRDDESMYVFAVGCNRIERVERAGARIPSPACPVDKLPTTMPRVYIAIMDLEAKRLDDAIAKLREQTRALAEATIGSLVGSRGFVGTAPRTPAEVALELARTQAAVSFLQSQVNDTLFDIRLGEQRVGALLDAVKSYPRPERQRYFFFAR